MDATEYMAHWRGKRVWEHLSRPIHEMRLQRCAALALGETFIDVGCALGHSTARMAEHRPGQWTGLDFDADAIHEAQERFPDIEFIYSPDYDLVHAAHGRRFDSVICSEVLEHVENDVEFLRRLAELATCRVVLTTPSRPIDDPGHLRCYARGDLNRLLAETDHSIETIDRFHFVTIETGGKR